MKILVYHNHAEGSGWRFDKGNAELSLVYEFEYLYTTMAPNVAGILEWCFKEFNIGDGDIAKEYREKKLRSLSVGDVVIIQGVVFAMQPIGWQIISNSVFQNAIFRYQFLRQEREAPKK